MYHFDACIIILHFIGNVHKKFNIFKYEAAGIQFARLAPLFVLANLYALTASVPSVLHVLSYILSMLLFCLFMLGLFML